METAGNRRWLRGQPPRDERQLPDLTVSLPDPSRATGTAVIIAPGGGFVWLSIDSEGHDAAKWLAARGIAGIILKYRLFQVEGQELGAGNTGGHRGARCCAKRSQFD